MPVYCPEAITFLLAMIWAITNSEVVAQQTNLSVNYPNALFQFFFYVYNNLPDYMAVFMPRTFSTPRWPVSSPLAPASSSRIPNPTRPSS